MTKHTKKLPLKILIYGLFLFFIYILQSVVFSRLTLFGVKPVIFPLAVVCTAMFEGCVKGGIFGLASGILCDISYNQPTIQFTLILTVLGIFIGVLTDTIFAKGFPTYLIASIFAILLCTFAQIFGLLIFHGIAFRQLFYPAAFQFLYSLLFLLPIYISVRSISRFSLSY